MSPATASPSFVVSDVTTKLLKNFSSIQNSVLLKPGKQQTTIAQGKSMVAIAEFPDAWPEETGIYDLATFLGTLSLHSKPQIAFEGGDKPVMVISGGGAKIKYRVSDPTTILILQAGEPGNLLRSDSPSLTFTLSDALLSNLNKSASVLGLLSPTGLITATVTADGAVVLRGTDEKNPSAHTFEMEVPAKDITVYKKGFSKTIHFRTEYVNSLLSGGYDISLSDKKYGFFKHQTEPISYYIVGQTIKA